VSLRPDIAFVGKSGAGKTTCAALLCEHFGYARLSFAGKHPGGLRDVMARIWGPDALTGPDFRDLAHTFGPAVRAIDEDAWVNAALRHLDYQRDPDGADHGDLRPVVCDDLRYKNEAWALHGRGFVIVRVLSGRHNRIARLTARGKLGSGDWENHESETELDKWPALYDIYNETTKKALFEQIVEVLRREAGIIRTPDEGVTPV